MLRIVCVQDFMFHKSVAEDARILACDTLLKALQSFETLGTTYLMTQRHVPKDMSHKQHHCENLRFKLSVPMRSA
jgi:hypothetical protein